MATTKKESSKKNIIGDNEIISFYMNDVLLHNEEPKNIYIFCKNHNINESDFYSFFGSCEAIKNEIWVKFFENALTIIDKDKGFESLTDKDNCSLYFSLFLK